MEFSRGKMMNGGPEGGRKWIHLSQRENNFIKTTE